MTRADFQVAIVGAGPAGIAAATTAAEQGRRVVLLDDNAAPGGQVWRGQLNRDPTAARWGQRFLASGATFLPNTRVFDHPRPHLLHAEQYGEPLSIGYEQLILSTGARERFLPFPGWTLPNVLGAGALQALVNNGLPIRGKRVVVAGTGPLLIAVAAHLRAHGAHITTLCDQAPLGSLARFAPVLLRHPRKLAEALRYARALFGLRIRTGCWPAAALGSGKLQAVRLTDNRRQWDISCDYLACSFHLVPNTELAQLLGCALDDGYVTVDSLQRTSVQGVFCAGEPTGIGGLDRSLVEGQIAGLAAAGAQIPRLLRRRHASTRRFTAALVRTTALRPELRNLPQPETLVCRCEDVPFGRLAPHGSWRSAKLQTRLGMGPCQGRICGPAAQFLRGWTPDSIRPPIFPVSLACLAAPLQSVSEDFS
jgi:NADPH-dependent 2,4-dienoyl-CoA reductase/sulfur reductase-like enzyme